MWYSNNKLGPKPSSGKRPYLSAGTFYSTSSPVVSSETNNNVRASPSNYFARVSRPVYNNISNTTVNLRPPNSNKAISPTLTTLNGNANPFSSVVAVDVNMRTSLDKEKSQNGPTTMPRGGAVGLWRMARDGHSPPRPETVMGYSPPASKAFGEKLSYGRFAPRSTEDNDIEPNNCFIDNNRNDRPSTAQTKSNFIPDIAKPPSSTNGSSNALINMSLDTAIMGGLGRSPKPAFPPQGTPSKRAPSPSTTATSYSKAPAPFARSASANPNTVYNNYLIPPLQLPTYTRSLPSSDGNTDDVIHQECRPAWVTVVFDLDETLCNNRLPGRAVLRPGCVEILSSLAAIRDDPEMNCYVEIVLWTASMECVAREALQRIDPNNKLFNHFIFRDRRWYREFGYTKDLKLLGRDMSHVVIIENSPLSVMLNRKHAILVKDFVGGGTFNYYYGGGSLNTRTSTSSMTDPSLFIVSNILCGWAEAVGRQALESSFGPNPQISRHDPSFVSLPMSLGIVEYLSTCKDISPNNEVVINQRNCNMAIANSPSPLKDRLKCDVGGSIFNRPQPSYGGVPSSYLCRSASASPASRRYYQ